MTKITFEDLPDTSTPLSAENLNEMQDNVENGINDGVIEAKSYADELQTYLTTEQVVGKWIDGKPLYRKVISITTPSSTSNTQIATFDSTYIIRDYKGKALISASQQLVDINFYFTAEYNVATYVIQNTHAINMKVGSTAYTSQNGYIILEYTKTTD